LPIAGRGEFKSLPLPERGRPPSDIRDHIIDHPCYHHDQFPLGMRFLIVEPAQRAADGVGKVILNKPLGEPCFGIALRMECFTKVAPLIAEEHGFDQQNAGNVDRGDFHFVKFSRQLNRSNDRQTVVTGDRRYRDGRGTIGRDDRLRVGRRVNSRASDC
jgi:hypothetical protein